MRKLLSKEKLLSNNIILKAVLDFFTRPGVSKIQFNASHLHIIVRENITCIRIQ